MVATASEKSLLLDSDACPSSSPPATTRSSGRPALRVEPSSCNCNLPRLPSTFALPLPSSFSFSFSFRYDAVWGLRPPRPRFGLGTSGPASSLVTGSFGRAIPA
ncbi:hypothetical protein Syun_020595 [Stephania yunnanensis]|uniref:Uncharacterized protein n=1 Tax=Stephania yunnanensis TaxID=152371 RepID=A0AAP0NP13_9MAGN